jgi:MoaA/NifB/PqqE/SkfB family radical SAM enzyme
MRIRKYLNVIQRNSIGSLWVFIHLARRFLRLDYLCLNGHSFYPDFITILITKRCNFNCRRCASKSPGIQEESFRELSTQELKKFIEQVSFFRPFIYFSGGEPLLRKDIFEIIKFIKSKRMLTGLVSNGSFLDENNVNAILDSGLDFFSVSIDGPRDYHDSVRGIEGAFDKAVRGLKLLIKARLERKVSHPHIRIASIIDPQNLANSIFVIDLANELKVDELAFGNLMFYTPEVKRRFDSFRKISDLDVSFINGMELRDDHKFSLDTGTLKKFLEYARTSSKVPVCFVPPQVDFINYYTLKSPSDGSTCLNPWFSVTIMPDGSVTPCQGLILGNIRNEKLRKLWNSDKIKKFRMIRKRSQPPGCFRCGEGQKLRFD